MDDEDLDWIAECLDEEASDIWEECDFDRPFSVDGIIECTCQNGLYKGLIDCHHREDGTKFVARFELEFATSYDFDSDSYGTDILVSFWPPEEEDE